uniref:Uncharacterized protein n=1 Tax=Manihot esculenta TaxID=3983 RepID=A0A2C9WL37_MANES
MRQILPENHYFSIQIASTLICLLRIDAPEKKQHPVIQIILLCRPINICCFLMHIKKHTSSRIMCRIGALLFGIPPP